MEAGLSSESIDIILIFFAGLLNAFFIIIALQSKAAVAWIGGAAVTLIWGVMAGQYEAMFQPVSYVVATAQLIGFAAALKE